MSNFLDVYNEMKPKFKRLESNIVSVLQQILNEKKIPLFEIESRIKDEESLVNKIASKGYSSPFDEIDDFCGVRIICYYQEDIEAICSIIGEEFDVLKKENKQDELSDNQFGYASSHYIIQLKKEWLGHPNARGLDSLRAEVQVRTMLMHTWAAISHKLLYKNEDDIPSPFKRKLNRLSALIELADEQFDQIKNIKSEYNDKLLISPSHFDSSGELNSDSLMALKKHFFSERIVSDDEIPHLLDEIRSAGFNLSQFVIEVERNLTFFDEMEKEAASNRGYKLPMWAFSGVIRTILDLTSPDYFAKRESTLPDDVIELKNKYRKIYLSKI